MVLTSSRQRYRIAFCLLLAILAFIGLQTADDYGITIDDSGLWAYGDHVVLLYKEALLGELSFDPGPDNLRFYGPAFLVFATLLKEVVLSLWPSVQALTIWHFSIFLSFLAGLPGLYYISRLLFNQSISLLIVLVYVSQPLLWGHSFINGKDIPFLSFFLLSVASGIALEKLIQGTPPIIASTNLKKSLQKDAQEWKSPLKGFWIVVGICFIATVFNAIASEWPKTFVESFFLNAIADNEAVSGKILHTIAENFNSARVEDYISKGVIVARWVTWLALSCAWLAIFGILWSKAAYSRSLITNLFRAIPWKTISVYLRQPAFWFASLTLAFTWAIRVVAPFAWVLVAYYLFSTKKLAALPIVLTYGAVASLGTYILWPYLWPAPISHLLASLGTMANFPQENLQLLNGNFYTATTLPFYFVPELMMLQISLPTLLLIVGVFLKKRHANHCQKLTLRLLSAWIGIPLLYCILFQPPMYNNFRQWLFILPPLFVMTGYMFTKIRQIRFGRPALLAVATLVLLVNGLSIGNLHPYQYLYYNALVGGPQGASGRFEMDYWATALHSAMLKLNEIAPEHSRVVIWSPNVETASEAARDDLIVEREQGGTYDIETGYDFAIIQLGSTRNLETPYPNAPIVAEVTIDNVPLAIVKQISHPQSGEDK